MTGRSGCLDLTSTRGCQLELFDGLMVAGLVVGLALAVGLYRSAAASLVTLRATALVPALSRRLARWVTAHDYSDSEFFAADGANEPWVRTRRDALERLAASFREQHSRSAAWSDALRGSFSDLRFTDANRVPFPFARIMRDKFNLSTVVTASRGPRLRDLDGHWSLDVGGSYGVNVAGVDRYKAWMEKGWERVKELGPVLGPLHPVVADNVAMLRAVSGMDEVSFHMSGTEAVMAAVRLARFNTGRKLIVCFAGAYHGWWDGVVTGLGSDRPLDDCLTLKDLHPASLEVIRRRGHEIAAVLVNPVQSFHPNRPPPNDAVLLTSEIRKTNGMTDGYADWLRRLRAVCSSARVPLVFDEVYTGFRLAPGGGQAYFGVEADMVVYGKTVAGGLPIGVVCGTTALMRRFDPERPMRLAYVVGTFSAHPSVMGAMNEFLNWVTGPTANALYREMNERCAEWVLLTNQRLASVSLPVRVVHLGTVWTVLFNEPGRYNWLLQYYLRAQGVALSWVGTGRCLISMDFKADDYQALQAAIVAAAWQMKQDGWWLTEAQHPGREKRMRNRLAQEMLGSLVQVPRPLKSFYADVMRRKEDDHHASHSNRINQALHLLSSSVFVYCYVAIFSDLTVAMCLGLASLFVRQFGHAVLEPPCHEKEETLLGYNTRNKTMIVTGYLLIPAMHMARASVWSLDALRAGLPLVSQQWFLWTAFVIAARVAYLVWKYRLPHVDDLVRQARHRPVDRYLRLLSVVAAARVTWWLFAASAVLLSLERIAYVWIWRHPAAFRAWCARPVIATIGGPVEVVRCLFFSCKAVQAAVFVVWFYVHGAGVLLPPPGGLSPVLLGSALVAIGQMLTASAFFRLGRMGVFYGSRLGHDVPWCRQFPYSMCSHPQYLGAVLSIWGLFMIIRFPYPDWYLLPALETVYYVAGGYLEQ